MELFTFILCTGSSERVEVLPIGDAVSTTVSEWFASFDAAQATCAVVSEKELLLGVIESGFGSLSDFNSAVRELARKLLGDISQSVSRRTRSRSNSRRNSRRTSWVHGRWGGGRKASLEDAGMARV